MSSPYERTDVAEWLADLPVFPGERVMLDHVSALADPVVLDVGAGAGRLTASLREAGCRYVALDNAAQQLRTLLRYNPGAVAALANATWLSIATSSVDVVVMAFHVMEAILPGAARRRAINEASRVLKPGGWLFFSHHVRWRYRPVAMTAQWLANRRYTDGDAPEFGDLRLTGAPATGGVSFDRLAMHIPAERTLRHAAAEAGFLPRVRVPLTEDRLGRFFGSPHITRAVVRGWEKP